ncbi:MAG: helix-turn-helix transcriptional regulator [Blautia sp.]|nr:helix-turn-helix transcriptional regulator [Lachnospiraceae bacterium]MBP3901917.1 helix-turn-helix transcriptional regulator [Blautia sp.]
MRAELGRKETQTEARSRYLKEMMRVRGVTAEELSDMTGISKRTLERYMTGRTDPANAAGKSVALIAYALSINPYTLGEADNIKPGTAFGSDGKRISDKGQMCGRCDCRWAHWIFKEAISYNRLTPEKLSERSGVPCRTINDILARRSNICGVRARVMFRMCRAMIFHPFFLYGLRDMKEYDDYRQAYIDQLRERKEKSEILREAREIYERSKAETGEGTE